MGNGNGERIPKRRRTALVIAPARGGNREIVQTLKRERFDVTSVETVYEGIAEFAHDPKKIVILSLEGLGRRDRKTIRIFQRRAPEMRVLLLVPEGRRSEVPAYLNAGADAIIPAPVYGQELKMLVRSLLRGDAADPLTGLPNKEAYERAFPREASRAKREGKTLALAILDLDGFGDLNAEHGYLKVDRILRDTADRLKDSVRMTDLMTRWGGDEFVGLVTRLPKPLEKARAELLHVLRRVRARMEEPFTVDSKQITVTIKGGIAFSPHEGETRAELFDVANERLKRANREGGDRLRYGDEDADEVSADHP